MVLIKRYREIPTSGYTLAENATDESDQREPEPLFVEEDETSGSLISEGEMIPGMDDERYAGGAFTFPVVPRFTVEDSSYQFVFWNWTSSPASEPRTEPRLGETPHVQGEARAEEDTITLWYERVGVDGKPVSGRPGVTVRGFSVSDNKFFRKPPIASVIAADPWDGSSFVSTERSEVTIIPRSDYLQINVLLLRSGYAFAGWLASASSPSPDVVVAQGASRRAIALYKPSGKRINVLSDLLARLMRGEKIDVGTIQPPGPHERFDQREIAAIFARVLVDAPAHLLDEVRPKMRSMIGSLTAIDRAMDKHG